MRGAIYTVPASKILYVSQIATGYAVSGTPNMNYARLFLRANYNNGFNTGSLFYTHAEILTMNNDVPTIFEIPMRFTAGTDIKMSGLGTLANMPASVSMRGWLETT
jgi:hypothetical protein